ncbi:MAG: succinate--CoA ligase subunit alpha, partial [Pseudomonadota bacterium]|nr:succinate--CoA ligase subunit alpha [Pseudomonadota bacterium]
MLLLEHDAKTLLQAAGVAVPPGVLMPPGVEAELPPGPWVVKAQVLASRRGKAGGIRAAGNLGTVVAEVAALIGQQIGGYPVRACRVEQQVRGNEISLSLGIDPASGGVRLLFSP